MFMAKKIDNNILLVIDNQFHVIDKQIKILQNSKKKILKDNKISKQTFYLRIKNIKNQM